MAEFQGEPQTTDAHVPDAPRGHEQSDVTLRPLLQSAGILVALAVFAHVALWLAMRSFERDERREDPPPSPVAEARPAPPEPRLQPTIEAHPTLPREDLLAMRAADHERLTKPEWVDRAQGIARIPIDRAMEQMVEESRRGAPTTRGANR